MKVFLALLIQLLASLLLLPSEVKCRRRIRGDGEYEVSHIRKRSMKFKEFFNEDNLQKVCSICEKEFQIDQANCVSRKQRAKLKCMIKVKENRALFESKLTELNSPAITSAPVIPTGADAPFCGQVHVNLNDDERKAIDWQHNDYRKKEKAGNMLKMWWNEEIAMLAQDKANGCEFWHSKTYDCKNRRMGQNLYANRRKSGRLCALAYNVVLYNWAVQRENWDFATNSCRPGQECEQWQNMVGAVTSQVGCGRAACPTLHGTSDTNAEFVVCNYRPYYHGFSYGERCSDCGNAFFDVKVDGHRCDSEGFCDPCDPKTNPQCNLP